MQQYEFKHIDREGLETLEAIANADQFNGYMYDAIKPHCKGRILEIGSGIGNISQFFFRDGSNITLSDIRDNYCMMLRDKFSGMPGYSGVERLDLVHEHFGQHYAGLLGTFDTVFALNVVEHIKDDQLAIDNCYKLLKPGGHLVILVPAYQAIYNRFDKELEHYRRYTMGSLSRLFHKQFTIIHRQYFNLVGIAGWIFSGAILRKKTIPAGQMGLYNKLVPVVKLIDRMVFNTIGLSVIVVGKK